MGFASLLAMMLVFSRGIPSRHLAPNLQGTTPAPPAAASAANPSADPCLDMNNKFFSLRGGKKKAARDLFSKKTRTPFCLCLNSDR